MLNLSPIFNAMMRNKSSVLLIIMQIALTLAIVSNSAFIISARIADMQRPTGISETELIGMNIYFYNDKVDIGKQLLVDQQKVMELPGVIEATAINQLPLSGAGDSWGFRNKIEHDGATNISAGVFLGNYNIADVFDLNIRQGRNFRPDEVVIRNNNSKAPKVAIVTQAVADELYPEGDAIGKYIYSVDLPIQIIGIVDQMQGSWLHSSIVEQTVLMPVINAREFIRFVVRVEPDMVEQVRKQLQGFLLQQENRRVIESLSINTLAELKEVSYQSDKLMTNMLVVIIAVLVFITALGIAGMTIFNVNRRTKQIGTRRALGASKVDILQYFIVEGCIVALIGMVLGLVLTFALNNSLMEYFQMESLAINYIAATMVCIILVILFAVFWPARKAASISPAIATRSV